MSARLRKCINFSALCYFHARKSLWTHLKLLECGVPLKHRKAFISAFFHIVDAPTAAEERERWLAYVRFLNAEYPDLPRTPDGRNSVWIQYLLDNWMCTEWHCAFVLRVRNIVSHYLNNTTNDAELLFNNWKNARCGRRRFLNMSKALFDAVGQPGNAELTYSSITAKSYRRAEKILTGVGKLSRRKHVTVASHSLSAMINRQWQNPALVKPIVGRLGVVTVGECGATFQYRQPSASRVPISKMDAAPVGPVIRRSAAVGGLDEGAGRTPDGISAVRAAMVARAGPAADGAAVVTAASGAGGDARPISAPDIDVAILAAWLHTVVHAPFYHDAFPPAQRTLKGDAGTVAAALRGRIATLPPPLVSALATLVRAPPSAAAVSTGAGQAASQPALAAPPARLSAQLIAVPVGASPLESARLNQALRFAINRFAWAVPHRSDFKGQTMPDCAGVYIIMVTLAAADWLQESTRLLVTGENISLMFGTKVELGFKITVNDTVAMAQALCDAGRGAELLTGFYVGKTNESRPKNDKKYDDRLKRFWAHGLREGNDNIAELLFFTSKRVDGKRCEGVGKVVFERRVVALMPSGFAQESSVLAVESLVQALITPLAGVTLNNTACGIPLRRFLAGVCGEPSISDDGCRALVQQPEVESYPASNYKVCYWMKRALCVHERLLRAGIHVRRVGAADVVTVGALANGGFTCLQVLGAWKDTLEQLSTIPYEVHMYAGYCSCGNRRNFLCPHLMLVRVLYAMRKWGTYEFGDREMLLFIHHSMAGVGAVAATPPHAIGDSFLKGHHAAAVLPAARVVLPMPLPAESFAVVEQALATVTARLEELRQAVSTSAGPHLPTDMRAAASHAAKMVEAVNRSISSSSSSISSSQRQEPSSQLERAAFSAAQVNAAAARLRVFPASAAAFSLAQSSGSAGAAAPAGAAASVPAGAAASSSHGGAAASSSHVGGGARAGAGMLAAVGGSAGGSAASLSVAGGALPPKRRRRASGT
jgi:hypothetical protein